MIIWGFDGNYKQLGEGPIGECNNCNNLVVFQVIQQSRRFKLYFIPVLKYNSQYWALCPTCTAGYQLPNKNDAMALIAESNVKNQELIGKFMELDSEEFKDAEDAVIEEQPQLMQEKESVSDDDIEALEAELEEMKKRKVEAEKKKKEEEAKQAAEVAKLTKELEELKKEVEEIENS